MLQILNNLTALRNHIEELRLDLSARELDEWKRTALQLVGTVGGAGEPSPGGDGHARLSPRESEVMRLMLDGRRLKEIAAQLGISVKTVTTHRVRLLRKLKLTDNLGLYRYGVRNGFISL
ncbi:MAG: response regulator transcription factor [Thermoanaerobaculia bacterium]